MTNGPPPSQSRPVLMALAFLLVVLLGFFFDVIFMGKTISALHIPGVMGDGPYGYQGRYSHRGLIDPGGSTWGPRPHGLLVSRLYKNGSAPLWTPYQGTGQPLAANMDSNAFNPLRLPLVLCPSPFVWDMFFLFRIFLAGAFTYLFARQLLGSEFSSLIAALLFMFSGSFLFSIDMHHLDVECVLPMLLFALEKMAASDNIGRRWHLLACIPVFLTLVGGQPQSAFLVLAFGCAYYLFRIFSLEDRRGFIAKAKRAWDLALVYIGGFGLAAVLLVPFLEFYHLSWNSHDPRPGYIAGITYDKLFADIVSFFVPYVMGPIHASWFDGFNWHFLLRGYVGVGAVFFLLIALLGCRREERDRRSIILFFGIALMLMLAKLYGVNVVNWFGSLPVSNMVRYWKYLGPLIAFSCAILAAYGIQRAAIGSRRAAVAAAVVIVLTMAVAFFCLYPEMPLHSDTMARLARHSRLLSLTTREYVLLQMLVAAAFTALFLAACLMRGRRRLRENTFKAILAVLVLAELFIYMPNPGLKKGRNERSDIFTQAPYISFLTENIGGQRIAGIDGIMYPDFASAFGLRDIRVLDGLMEKGYMEFVRTFFPLPDPPDRFTGDEGLGLTDPAARKALNLLGVRYVLSGPHRNSIQEDAVFPLVYDKEVRIYENKDALARAFVVHGCEVVKDRAAILHRLKGPAFDPRRTVILEEDVSPWPSYVEGPAAPGGAADIVRDEASLVEIKAELTHPGFLVLTDAWYPGWIACVDGARTRIYRSNYAFRSVFLTPGAHSVRFVYEPLSLKVGLIISLSTLGCLAALVILPKRRNLEHTQQIMNAA